MVARRWGDAGYEAHNAVFDALNDGVPASWVYLAAGGNRSRELWTLPSTQRWPDNLQRVLRRNRSDASGGTSQSFRTEPRA